MMKLLPDLECSIADYRRDGFVIFRGLFDLNRIAAVDAEVRDLPKRLPDLVRPNNLRCRFRTHVESGDSIFETFDPIVDLSAGCRLLAYDERLAGVLQGVYGEPARLFKDKLIYKPPGAEGYPLHQDYIAWSGFPRSFLTVLIPLESADESNGCTVCYSGYHTQGFLSPEDGRFHPLDVAAFDSARAVPLILEPGDIAVFGGFTPHRSDPNRSNRWRRQLYLSYNAASDGGDRRDAHYAQFHAWLHKAAEQRGELVDFR